MKHRHGHGCGHRGRIEFSVPEALFAMRSGRGGHWGPFNFEFDESGFGGGRGRGRGRRRVFESGELRLVLLKLIADEPRHGYDLIRAIEDLTGNELVDEDYEEVVDVVLLWWREDDGDLVDALMDSLADLGDGGVVWLLTPKAGREGHVEPSDIGDAAPTAGLNQTSSISAAPDWSGTRLVSRKTARR